MMGPPWGLWGAYAWHGFLCAETKVWLSKPFFMVCPEIISPVSFLVPGPSDGDEQSFFTHTTSGRALLSLVLYCQSGRAGWKDTVLHY